MPNAEKSLKELLHEIRRIEEHREVLTEKKIKSIYRSLKKSLNAYLAEEYINYSDADGRFYISYLDAQNKKAKFLEEIAENVSSFSPQIKKEILDLVDETYSESYKNMLSVFKEAQINGTIAEVAKDIDVNPDVLNQAVNNNISKLTLNPVLEKHRNEIIYDIQQTLVIGLMNGDRYERMAQRIAERIDVSEGKARNIVRTESHRNIENGFMDCAENLQSKFEGSEFIYAATWRTMQDERVRPQQRRKTKSGWKTTFSKNGANHMILEGQTVKAGDNFDLGYYNGRKVTAKNPSRSGVAAHDCNCRCFLEYNLMTVEEFAKATGQTPEQVRQKYKINEPIQNENYNTQKINKQYKETQAMNEYDYFSEEQERFRLNAIKEMSGADDEQSKKYLNALCGNRNSYIRASNSGVQYAESWFFGGDMRIRTGELREEADIIHDYIAHSPKYEGEIYRGLSLSDSQISEFKTGGTFRENGLLSSWTSSDDVAKMFADGRSEELGLKPVILKSQNPEYGTPVSHLSIFGVEEQEVLVSNIVKDSYIIGDIFEKEGYTIIELIGG